MFRNFVFITLALAFIACSSSENKNPETAKTPTPEPKKYEFEIKGTPEKQSISAKPDNSKKARNSQIIEGYFAYAADAEIFYPCGEKEGITVLKNDQYLALEKAYIRLKDLEFAEKVYTKVQGKYLAEAIRTGGFRKKLMIDEFVEMERGKSCN